MEEQDTVQADHIHREDQIWEDYMVVEARQHESLTMLRFHLLIAKKTGKCE